MATKYGIELRKIRIERGENLLIMANKLGISPSYLSSIENGSRRIPEEFTKKIMGLYFLTNDEKTNLEQAENLSIDEVNIRLSNLNKDQKQLALLLSRKLPTLENAEDLIHLLLKEEGDE